jgi:hypothetical protein
MRGLPDLENAAAEFVSFLPVSACRVQTEESQTRESGIVSFDIYYFEKYKNNSRLES